MRHPARMKALLVGAACGVALLGAGLAFREDLAFHYHAWRLERAMTLDDAQPWLEKLEGHVQDPALAQQLVAMLGPRRPRLTYWVFQWPFSLVHEENRLVPGLGGLRHLARSLEERLRCDETFMVIWGHFVRWRRYMPRVLGFSLGPGDVVSGIIRLDLPKEIRAELGRCAPADQETRLRLQEVWLIGEAWLYGMSALPAPLDFPRFPVGEADLDFMDRRWEDLQAWIEGRRAKLRFDPALGRFVEVPAGQGDPAVPVPTEPLPGWTGPVPQLP